MVVRVQLAALGEEVSGNVIRLPGSIWRDLSISEASGKICVGQSVAQAQVEGHCAGDDNRRIYLSKNLLVALHLREHMRLGIWRDHDSNCLRLGPVLGILV